MNTKLKNTKVLLATAIIGGAFAPVMAQAGGTEAVIPLEQSTEVIGTFQSTTLDVSIPATSSFLFDPDTGTSTIPEMSIQNNTNAPVYLTSKAISVSPISTWKPILVEPGKYTNWNSLSKAETNQDVSLGLKALTGANWLSAIQNAEFNSVDIATGKKIGVIKPKLSVNLQPTVKAGTSFDSPKILTSNYVFEFGLE